MKNITVILLLLISSIMTAQTQPKPSVDVTGVGTVSIVPDEVTINVRVEHTGNNAIEVKKLTDNSISEVLQFVKRAGVDDKYVKTEYVRLSKNYEYNTKTYNFVANQAITIKLVDLSKYESVVNGLLDTGINRIDGVSFSSSEMETLQSQARKKAIANAKMKAQEYTSVLNQNIGKAIHISEFRNVSNPQPMLRSAMMSMDSEASGKTLAPGEMQIKVKVNVSFELID